MENNSVELCGVVVSGFKRNYAWRGEGFYQTMVEVERKSGNVDIVPVTVSERLVDVDAEWEGKCVRVSGSFRSYNNNCGNKRLLLYVFAEEFEEYEGEYTNEIILNGYICKNPIYRKTPLKRRSISDLTLAVNRPYRKSDYIPCIAWDRNARSSAGFQVGTHIKLKGRIQSRGYLKMISEYEAESMVAYEVSIAEYEVINDEENGN